ncbi:CRISPR-associated endonuclease Cas2 [Thiolapillus sp.]
MARHLHLIAYDIAHPRRLRRALREARTYALDGQKSVFECFLSRKEKSKLGQTLREIINPEEDRLLIIRLPPESRMHHIGARALQITDGAWIIAG